MPLKKAVVAGRCLFCKSLLGETTDNPENLAFLRHIETRPDCRRAFDAWREQTATDAGGD